VPSEIIGFTAPSDRPAAEQHVDRCHEDVQVLGMQHEDQERQHHADVEKKPDADQGCAVGQHLAEQVGDERSLAVAVVASARGGNRHVAGLDGAPEPEQAPHDVEDHEEREVRRTEVGPEES
jgi:hypothetical protein